MCRKTFFKAWVGSGWILRSLWNYLQFLQNLHNLLLKALWLLWVLGHGQFSVAGKSGVSRTQYWVFCFERISLRAAKSALLCSLRCVLVVWLWIWKQIYWFQYNSPFCCLHHIFHPKQPLWLSQKKQNSEIPCHFLRLEAMAEICECDDGNFMTDNCIIKSSKLITGYHYTWSSLACLKNWLNPSLGRVSTAKEKCERKLILIPCNIKKWWSFLSLLPVCNQTWAIRAVTKLFRFELLTFFTQTRAYKASTLDLFSVVCQVFKKERQESEWLHQEAHGKQ